MTVPSNTKSGRPSLLRILGATLAALVVLVAGYEAVEAWLVGGVAPESRPTLELVRWLGTAAILTTLVTYLVLRQRDASSALPPRRRSWQAFLQHVGIRTKVIVPIAGLTVASTLAIGLLTLSHMQRSLQDQVLQRIRFDTVSKAQVMETFLRDLHRDLRVLSQAPFIQQLAAADARGAADEVARLRTLVERELSIFSQGRSGYQHLRYLNSEARELLHLDADLSLRRLVPVENLEETADEFYSDAAFALEPGQVYLSSVELDVESGAGTSSMLRCATPVVWETGRKRGLLVVDVDPGYFFSLVGTLPSGVEAWLFDQKGMYLGYVGESQEKKTKYAMAEMRSISADFSPENAAVLLDTTSSQPTIETGESLLSLAPIRFDAGTAQRRWTLMIAHPIAPVHAPVRQATVLLWFVVIFVIAVAANIGIIIGHYVAQPLAVLRGATREIAAGDLSRRVEITTGDEIEGLATDFNSMADRLRDAQQRLSAWNESLRREVQRQTAQMRQLQTGLARADKLASIGQMTRSIMHEVGNPLAAIKTKIQVAEESRTLNPGDRAILPDVLREVDRLSAVLRSFSRLGRPREPVFDAVSLDGVVHGVTGLVTPELKRNGINLRVMTGENVPTVRGDADQLRQLLINLILNAAEASPDGGEIVVRVRRDAHGPGADGSHGARIEIEDHGMGISPENLPRIWDPLFTTKPEGTGLGLAICRKIVEDHGGTLEVESRREEGTVVTILFPGLEDAEGTVP